jgi:hypothetical protein
MGRLDGKVAVVTGGTQGIRPGHRAQVPHGRRESRLLLRQLWEQRGNAAAGRSQPRIGRGAFVETTHALGCFTELIELNDHGWSILQQIHAAHLAWDGRDPMRAYPVF